MGYTNKDRAYKSFIVSFFYDVRNFKGSVSSLAGPQLKRVVDIIDKLNPNYINIYENCPATFNKQLKDKKKYFDSKENLLLNFESLEESEIVEFIDADLMKTYRSDGLIIKSLLNKQIKLESDGDKIFVGTISIRGTKKETAFNWLERLVKPIGYCKVLNDDSFIYKQCSGTNHWMQKYNIITDSNISVDLFLYNDAESPMMTFRIIY